LYIELRNRNIITADDYLGECILNCMDLTGLAPTDLWVGVKDKNRNLTGGKIRLRIYCRHVRMMSLMDGPLGTNT